LCKLKIYENGYIFEEKWKFIRFFHYHTQKEKIKLNIAETIVNDIYYGFRFRDLSKEAIMILAESLIN
jgi:hypothetical protein